MPARRVPARGRVHGAAAAGQSHGPRRRHRTHGGRHPRGGLGRRPDPGMDVPVLQLRGQGRLLRLQGQGDPRHHRPGHPAVHARLDRALHGAELAGAPVDAQQPRKPASRRDGVLHRARFGARGLHKDRRPRGHLALRPGLRLGPHPGLRLRAAFQDVPGARLPRARDPRARPVEEPARHGDRPPRRPDRAPRPGHVRPRAGPPLLRPRRAGRHRRARPGGAGGGRRPAGERPCQEEGPPRRPGAPGRGGLPARPGRGRPRRDPRGGGAHRRRRPVRQQLEGEAPARPRHLRDPCPPL